MQILINKAVKRLFVIRDSMEEVRMLIFFYNIILALVVSWLVFVNSVIVLCTIQGQISVYRLGQIFVSQIFVNQEFSGKTNQLSRTKSVLVYI